MSEQMKLVDRLKLRAARRCLCVVARVGGRLYDIEEKLSMYIMRHTATPVPLPMTDLMATYRAAEAEWASQMMRDSVWSGMSDEISH